MVTHSRIRTAALTALVMTGAFLAGCGEKAPKYDTNLLKDGGFEEVGSNGLPKGWTLEPFRGGPNDFEVEKGIKTDAVHSGKNSWGFRGDPGTRRWYLLSQEVPVDEAATHVRIEGWLQTDDAHMMPDQFAQANFLLTFYDKDHNRFQDMRVADKRTPLRAGSNPWLEERYQFRVPKGTRFAKISCVLGMNGQVWFDDVALVIPKPIKWETAETKNYKFHWLPGHPMPEGSQQAQQQIFDYVAERLRMHPDIVISYYFYPDTASIRNILSLKGWEYVSWDDFEFHSINANENHEVVHFITDPIGRPPRAIAEGTVFWIQDDWGGKKIDDCMRQIVAARAVPKLGDLFDYNALAMADPNVTMPCAASWVGFLVDRWGAEKLMAFYGAVNGRNGYAAVSPAFEQTYGVPMTEAEEAWRSVLRAKFVHPAGRGSR